MTKAWDSIDADQLLAMRRNGQALYAIAEAFDVPEYFIRNRCRDLSIPVLHRANRAPGDDETRKIRNATRTLLRRIAHYHPERAPGIAGSNEDTKPTPARGKKAGKDPIIVGKDISDAQVKNIINDIARIFGVSADGILGASKAGELIKPRFAAYYILNKRVGIPYFALAKIMGRDHTTVISGVERAQELLNREPLFSMAVNAILPPQ